MDDLEILRHISGLDLQLQLHANKYEFKKVFHGGLIKDIPFKIYSIS
jgi:hypothetical protein